MSLTCSPANSLLTRTTYSNVATLQAYNDYGELTTYETKYGVSTLFKTSYTRDSLGRISRLSETIEGESKTFAYSYDQVGRLNNAKENGVLVSSYSYDADSNRIVTDDLNYFLRSRWGQA